MHLTKVLIDQKDILEDILSGKKMLDTSKRKETTFFIGTEIEQTPMKGTKTLFVVGIKPANEIDKIASKNNIKNIYFGTSQSFNPSNETDWKDWYVMMTILLEKNYWVTLDFDISYSNDVIESGLMAFEKFIPMISAKIPNIEKLNKNAVLKIDDTTWGLTNKGVWSKDLNTLKGYMQYTEWSEYKDDTVLDIDNEK